MKENEEFYIGVTGCPVGIAHTYVAAKSLQKAAERAGITIKVETNGSIGVENSPTPEEIEAAKAIIVASDKAVDLERFAGKKVIITGTKEAIKEGDKLIKQAIIGDIPVYQPSVAAPVKGDEVKKPSSGPDKKKEKVSLYKYLMNGVSYMVPFVVTGGLLIALSLSIGGKPTPNGLVITPDSIWNHLLAIGAASFTLMIPILAGFIAYAIADRSALVAGMIGGWIANNGSFYGADAGTGFIGAIIAGFMAGYCALLLRRLPWHRYIQPLVPIMIIPIISSLIVGLSFIFIIGAPVAGLMTTLEAFLRNLSMGSVVVLGLVMGLMQGFDLGGPFAKVAFIFSVGLISAGETQFMGALAASIPAAPLGMGLATLMGKRFFNEEERENGKAALAMGLVGISEGAIPFAAADPLAVIPATMLGSVVACVLGFAFGLTDSVAHGGPVVALLGAMNKPVWALIIMFLGALTTALTAIALKAYFFKKRVA